MKEKSEMDKLTRVRKALEGNSNITIVAVEERNYIMSRSGSWGHTVNFYVAPKNGGIYTAEELQMFMMALVPSGLEPTCRDNFREQERTIEFGKLYFDEDIGTEIIYREITLTDKNMISFFNEHGFVGGRQVISGAGKIKRRIWVRLFPSKEIANAAFKDD